MSVAKRAQRFEKSFFLEPFSTRVQPMKFSIFAIALLCLSMTLGCGEETNRGVVADADAQALADYEAQVGAATSGDMDLAEEE